MNKLSWRTTAFWSLAVFALAAHTRVSAQASPATKPDYSKEPYIIQSATSKLVFQNGGQMAKEDTLRILIQSNAGLQAWGILHFSYASATSTMEVAYVRVTKPDGSVTETPAGDVMEVTPDISREAPMYSDLKEKQVAVKGLQAGDSLEYESREEITNPLIPGQFWYSYNFIRGAVALGQELRISVPQGRYVQVKNRDVQPTITDQGDARIYDWKTASLQPTSDQDPKGADSGDADGQIPSVQLTTFHSWDEVGQWFKSLADPQAAVTPAIQAKANAVTVSAKSDSDKVHALYDFVSTKFRYVGISLGIKAVPVLINSGAKIDPDVPSPGQFDHVITAVPQEKGYQFLDTTPEVAPYGLLMGSLRDKQALVIPAQGPAVLVQTPKDPPFKPFTRFSAVATLDDAGTLESLENMILRGDDEVIFRSLLRQAGPAKWNDVMQVVMSNLGFSGTVSNVSSTSPEATADPIRITYNYSRKEYSDWTNRRITPPMPPLLMPNPPDNDNKSKPIKIGSPDEIFYQSTVKLPPGSAPSLPTAVDLHESFADYQSTYSFADGAIHAERRLTIKVSEVPVAQIEAYRALAKAIENDENAYIPLKGGSDSSSGSGSVAGATSPLTVRESPSKPESRDLLDQAQGAYKRGDWVTAIEASQKAVKDDPELAAAWLVLGTAQIDLNREADGLVSIKKAIALDTANTAPYETAALRFRNERRFQPAIEIWKALAAAKPEDSNPPVHIAQILSIEMLYSDAVKELQPALQRNPNDQDVVTQLGYTYLHFPNKQDKEKGAELLVRGANLTHGTLALSRAASSLSENNFHLDDALSLAQQAVQQAERDAAKLSLSTLTLTDVRSMGTMDIVWDTLGWVQYQLGHFDEAEKYLSAAWRLGQRGSVASHLGLLYEKEGKKHDAALAYAGALSFNVDREETEKRLEAVQNGEKDKLQPSLAALETSRTMETPWQHVATNVSADFFVLLAPGPTVADVKFVSGSEELRDATKVLVATHFDVLFPDGNPSQILRRGRLSCGPQVSATHCVFVLYRPNEVNSVN